jgi:hypothetical protein
MLEYFAGRGTCGIDTRRPPRYQLRRSIPGVPNAIEAQLVEQRFRKR